MTYDPEKCGPCPDCGGLVSLKAKQCPHCGAKLILKGNSIMAAICVGAIALFIVVSIYMETAESLGILD